MIYTSKEMREFGEKWDRQLTKVRKKELLKQAGHNPNSFSSRVWFYIPMWVQHDIMCTLIRSQKEELKTNA